MPIQATCQCGKTYTVSDEMAGRIGKCKACGQAFQVPAGIDLIEVSGPTTLQMAKMSGKRCPRCNVPVLDDARRCDECGADLSRPGGRTASRTKSRPRRLGPHPLVQLTIFLIFLGSIAFAAWLFFFND